MGSEAKSGRVLGWVRLRPLIAQLNEELAAAQAQVAEEIGVVGDMTDLRKEVRDRWTAYVWHKAILTEWTGPDREADSFCIDADKPLDLTEGNIAYVFRELPMFKVICERQAADWTNYRVNFAERAAKN